MAPELSNSIVDHSFASKLHRHSFSPDSFLESHHLLTLEHVRTNEAVGFAEYNITYKRVTIATLYQSWMPETPEQCDETLSIWTTNEDYWGSDDTIRHPLIDGWTMNEPEKKVKHNYYWGRYYENEYVLYSAKHACGATFRFLFKTT